jgi:hypothetical protein
VLSAAYLGRRPLARVYIAWRVHRLQLFTPPANVGVRSEGRFLWDVLGLRDQRNERNRRFEAELKPLVKTIGKRQAQGKNVALSVQIYRETRWWINFTADENKTEQRLAELRKSLESDADQDFAQQQSATDGSWGPGYTVWFMKLYGSVNDALARGALPRFPMAFLDRINSPALLTAHLTGIVHNDFLTTGRVHRQEVDETVSALARLFGDVRTDYPFHPELKATFLKFVDDWQNPETGCWGVWYVDRDGNVWKQDDVGITFHIVSDRDGNVNHLDRIARRVLELSKVDFPAGIRMNGRYENHLNWDVVKIMKYAWPHLDEPTRQAVAGEFSRMLTWCLAESYQPDGSFKLSELDDTPGDAMQYGTNFLRDLGFFQKAERFWTTQDFPQAKAIHAQIRAKLDAMGHSGTELSRAYKRLGPRAD